MDLAEIRIRTRYSFIVNFDIEAIEHYDGVYNTGNYPMSFIIDNDGRNPDAWIFLAYDIPNTGSIGTYTSSPICNNTWNNGNWIGVFESYHVRWCL